ncbi:PaaX family transcriptional regulator [Arthrobacter globiformis]|uniref:PaaX family transcriptional regulator n=1 Tax=Arthrobacter globiformis TaxID=1665 RepID=UPI0027919FEA|nr:PaaX family transcriptional regulator C-terminal domain-containing protein [Arthrobacter globiformis]MDQ0616671.1 phenylacetic acid degradation operon negative regulatory protein [Arthrobacter globiformis]
MDPDDPGATSELAVQRSRSLSARSLLLTLLGEFVLPHGGSVWTATITETLQTLGVEDKAARQALARTASAGFIKSERIGRRTLWRLTELGHQLLSEGTERIYQFSNRPVEWDGQWLVVAVTVPDTQRKLRHQLRTQLTWAGMGSPAPGLWVVPGAGRVDQVRKIVSDLGLESTTLSWIGPASGIGETNNMVHAAWRLDEVRTAYQKFLSDFEHRIALTPIQSFAAQTELVHRWRQFPFLDPELPAELLDSHWPSSRARIVFDKCHDAWHDRAQSYWVSLNNEAGNRN